MAAGTALPLEWDFDPVRPGKKTLIPGVLEFDGRPVKQGSALRAGTGLATGKGRSPLFLERLQAFSKVVTVLILFK